MWRPAQAEEPVCVPIMSETLRDKAELQDADSVDANAPAPRAGDSIHRPARFDQSGNDLWSAATKQRIYGSPLQSLVADAITEMKATAQSFDGVIEH